MTEDFREKPTSIDTVLPCVAELCENKPAIHRYVNLEGEPQVLEFRDLAQQDPYPIPLPVDREGYGTIEHSAQHWATGHGDWLNVKSACEQFLDAAPKRLLDFGCATGRFLRHAMIFDNLETHGCDFAPANIEWVHRHLPPEMNVVLNTASPHLSYPDNFFDIVTAFSVFTHIDDGESEWLAELSRIIHPKGIAYITVQNEESWHLVPQRPGMYEHLEKANLVEGNLQVNKELFDSSMPQDRIVFRKSEAKVYNCNVWHSNKFVNENWARRFEILKIAANSHTSFQSVVIMRPHT